MDSVYIIIRMVLIIRAFGITIFKKEKEHKSGQTEVNLMENSSME